MMRSCDGRARSQARVAKKLEESKEKKKKGRRENADEGWDSQGFSRRITSPRNRFIRTGHVFQLGLIDGALGPMGLSLRFKTSNGRALPQQMVVVIAAASQEHLPFPSDGYRNTDICSFRCHAFRPSSSFSCFRNCSVSSLSLFEEIIVLTISQRDDESQSIN